MTIPGFVNGDCVAGNLKMSGNTFSSVSGNINLNPFSSAVLLDKSLSAGDLTFRVYNTENTNSGSDALVQVLSGGSSGGKPYITIGKTATRAYALGQKAGADEKLYLTTAASASADPNSTELMNMTTSGDPSYSSTGYVKIPTGTTAQRPGTPVEGMYRGNSSEKFPEYYDGTAWREIPLQIAGTFTPALSFGTGTTGITYSTQTGTYVVHGDLVWFNIDIVLTSKGTDTGLAEITGLSPYTPVELSYTTLQYGNITTTSSVHANAVIRDSSGFNVLMQESNGGGNWTDTNFANNSTIRISGVFRRN